MEKEEKILHIYGQSSWHNAILIVGTLPGLKELHNTLEKAIKEIGVVKTSRDVFINDGEGFVVEVVQEDENTLERLSVPYYDEVAREKEEWRWEELFKIFKAKINNTL